MSQPRGPENHSTLNAHSRSASTGTVLAFDFGEKRIGVAVGDTETWLAHPLTTIRRRKQPLALCRDRRADRRMAAGAAWWSDCPPMPTAPSTRSARLCAPLRPAPGGALRHADPPRRRAADLAAPRRARCVPPAHAAPGSRRRSTRARRGKSWRRISRRNEMKPAKTLKLERQMWYCTHLPKT